MRQSCELEVKRLQQKHVEVVKSAHHKCAERVKSPEEQLGKRKEFLQEHRRYIIMLDSGVYLGTIKGQIRLGTGNQSVYKK